MYGFISNWYCMLREPALTWFVGKACVWGLFIKIYRLLHKHWKLLHYRLLYISRFKTPDPFRPQRVIVKKFIIYNIHRAALQKVFSLALCTSQSSPEQSPRERHLWTNIKHAPYKATQVETTLKVCQLWPVGRPACKNKCANLSSWTTLSNAKIACRMQFRSNFRVTPVYLDF